MHRAALSLATGIAGAALLAIAAVAPATAATPATIGSTHAPVILPGLPLPPHISAPYVDVTAVSNLATISQESGSKYLSLAFLQTDAPGSCTVYWAGNTATPVAATTFGTQFDQIRLRGGDVIPSFGGYTADTTNTDIADSCSSVSAIAQVYENVITTYHVPRIDLDVEADSLNNTAGINRRNEAIAQVEAWAAAHRQRIQFSYTLPSLTTGLDAQDEAVLQNAIADGARISTVNLLTFDYYIGTAQEMATDTITAADGLHSQLEALYPQASPARLWRMVGVTEMPGIDDFGADETFTQADAATIIRWAQRTGIGTLSFWALQRDNGGCPGTKGAGTCSGLTQPAWYFSHVFEPFTRWW
jgi:hypothetical protein